MQRISKKKVIIYMLYVMLIFLTIIIISVGGYILFHYNRLDVKHNLLSGKINSVTFLDSNDNEIPQISSNNFISYDDLPNHLINAFISIEDKTFFNHKGLNYKRIVGALINNIKTKKFSQGASTITQQLIKNTHLSSEKTYKRKFNEALLSLKLEKQYTKKEIMQYYLNSIYFGNGCYGINNASNFYFSKTPSELDLNECAILSGIIKSPKKYDPILNSENLFIRKNLVLKNMLNDGYIDNIKYNEYINLPVTLSISKSIDYSEAYINATLLEASKILNKSISQIKKENIIIKTHLDLNSQKIAYENYIDNCYSDKCYNNSIIIDTNSCGIIAAYSSIKYGGLLSKRNPASTIKPPLVYAPAMDLGLISPDSLVFDELTEFEDNFTPKNIGDKYYGLVSIKNCIQKSLNVPAVKIYNSLSKNERKKYAKLFNINRNNIENNLASALGSIEGGIDIISLCEAYSPFINDGYRSEYSFIREITNRNNLLLYKKVNKYEQVISPETAQLMRETLYKSNIGTTTKLVNKNYDLIAKTGTNGNQNGNTDLIALASTKNHMLCSWNYISSMELLSNEESSKISPIKSISASLDELYKTTKPNKFQKTAGVISVLLDKSSYDNGKIELLSENAPKKFGFYSSFNKKYAPLVTSKNYDKIIEPNLKINTNDDKYITFTFNNQNNVKYDLCYFFSDKLLSSQDINNNINNKIYNIVSKNIKNNYTTQKFNNDKYMYLFLKYGYDQKLLQSNVIILTTNFNEKKLNDKWYFNS